MPNYVVQFYMNEEIEVEAENEFEAEESAMDLLGITSLSKVEVDVTELED